MKRCINFTLNDPVLSLSQFPGCGAAHPLADRVSGRKFRCRSCKAKIKHHGGSQFEIKKAAAAGSTSTATAS